MTGREMEARSGVPRAKNGCREYSEEDLALPERIKLLRRPGSQRGGAADSAVGAGRRSALYAPSGGTRWSPWPSTGRAS